MTATRTAATLRPGDVIEYRSAHDTRQARVVDVEPFDFGAFDVVVHAVKTTPDPVDVALGRGPEVDLYFTRCKRVVVVDAARVYATDRDESDPCQAGTPGCSIDHNADHGTCETW